MSAKYECNPLAVGRAVSKLGSAFQAIGSLWKAKEHYETAQGHAIYDNDLQGQGRTWGNIGNVCILLKEPVKAVHYYTETLHLSTDRSTKVTGITIVGVHNMILQSNQGKKPKELATATIPDSVHYSIVTGSGHVLSRSSRSDPLQNLSGSDLDWITYESIN